MKVINGTNVPETLKEASLMNYQELQKSIKVFNENGFSGEELKKAWEKQWSEGFQTAIDLVLKVLQKLEWGDPYMPETIVELIEEELERNLTSE